jgi:hypothetical protein
MARSTVDVLFGATLAATALVALALGACGSEDASASSPNDDGGAGTADGSGSGGLGVPTNDTGSKNYPCAGCVPFPALGAPECAPAVLGKATIAYPLDGLLLPPNMNVLEVQFAPPPSATLYEVDFYNAITKVKVETLCTDVPDVRGGASRGCGITLPQGAWNDIANANRDGDPVHVIVRATTDGSCVSISDAKIDLSFAKEDLAGGIYYWQSATFGGVGGKTGGIYSHDFGSFDPTPTPFYTSGGTGTCVGCHTLSRDGSRMAVMTDDPDGDDEFADVKMHVMDVATRTVLGGSKVSPGFQAFTHDHAKMIATTFKSAKKPPPGGGAAVVDGSFDIYDGDGVTLLANVPLPAGMAGTHPDLSRDDAHLVYVVPQAGSISAEGDHHFLGGALFGATFDAANNAIGTPAALLADPARSFYYPSFSPNGTFVMFNDAPQPGNTATANNDAFYNRGARVKIMHFPPAAGAKAIDLAALNVADGLTNSWPRWSPFVQTYKGHKLLWVTFSSNRDYGLHLVNKGFDNCYPPEGPAYDQPQPLSKQGVTYGNCAQPQIWMAGVIVDEDGTLDATDRSFPAFWLPFQDVNSHNHSAQWVEKVQGSSSGGDGGTGTGGMCVAAGGDCSTATCCSDVVCCAGTCSVTCVR